MENKNLFLKKIGENIKEIRKSKMQEVKEVARGLGITVQALGAIENGKTDLHISRLYEIANYFKVEFDVLLKTKVGDIFNYSSQNNSGGYHIQSIGVFNISDENLKTYLETDLAAIKEKIVFFEEALKNKK